MQWLQRLPAAAPPKRRASLFGAHITVNKSQCPITFLARRELPDTVRLDHGVMRGRTPDAVYTKDPPLARQVLQNPRNPRARGLSLFHHRSLAYCVPRDLVTYAEVDDPMVAKLRTAYIKGLAEALDRHRDEIVVHLDRWVERATPGGVELTRATRRLMAEIAHLLTFGRLPRNPLWGTAYGYMGFAVRDTRKRLEHLLWPRLDWLPTPYAAFHFAVGASAALAARAYYLRYRRDPNSLLGRLYRQGLEEGVPRLALHVQPALLNAMAAILPFPMVMALHELASRPDVQQRVVDDGLYAAVVKETLRLYPPVPGPARVVTDRAEGDSAVLEPMASAEGAVYVNIKAIHRDRRGWSRPDEFVIDRWLPGWTEDGEARYRLYMPFGLGPRTCVTAAVSPKILELFLQAVLSRRIVSNRRGRPPRQAEGVVALACYPFVLDFTERPASSTSGAARPQVH